ncbi:Na/Pi cotransporter family protein [Labrenzia sp. PHM005]|uniref:Na/Pi cotransporter family protein n=1 Tax=Labrenzia sp. PHM005 TaxID=2590016 RepID=UPI0011401D03|nr:Na/Pi symporter [Labrenzia sp. PHM005]QDG76622.1 Na/Pi cotransporter family protein [Labrenzia sp. PHM005]
MLQSIITVFGGLGLFLLGMHLMTSGLRQLAGNRLRQFLQKSTQTPLAGAVSGALATAALQSSSATTVATVGFVSAGLMTFPQALGVIFGANLGTTITGWMVALLGFKLKIGLLAQPLIFAGILAQLFGKGHWKPFGLAIAGFGLLFVGIDTLTQGFSILEGKVTPDDFPGDTLFGRFQLVLIGIVITLITQSSSAGVATALAALTVGAISFPQAAALVIGMDVGTTATAALATVGGSVASRRTGFAHVLYNLLTGFLAFWLLVPLGWLAASAGASLDPQVALVGFHTVFNLIGVFAVVGFTNQFARLIMLLIPSGETDPAERLDETLLNDPASALDAADAAVRDQATLMFQALSNQLGPDGDSTAEIPLDAFDQSIDTLRSFVNRIRTGPEDPRSHDKHLKLVHVLDHMDRLSGRLRQTDRILTIQSTEELTRLARQLAKLAGEFSAPSSSRELPVEFDNLRKCFREERWRYRHSVLDLASRDQIDLENAFSRVDAVRWLHRSAYHLWRISAHLNGKAPKSGTRFEATSKVIE